MKLSTTRDAAIIGGAIAAGTALAYLAIDDLIFSLRRATAAKAATAVPIGVHFDLIEVSTHHDGTSKGTYVRPATETEAKSSEAAELVDDGPGIFAVVEDGSHVLPGTSEWGQLIAPAKYGSAPVKYYRVG